jgi:exodeoxyribonuclease V alpha subunit
MRNKKVYEGIAQDIKHRSNNWQVVEVLVDRIGDDIESMIYTEPQSWMVTGYFICSPGDRIQIEGELQNNSYGYQIKADTVKIIGSFVDSDEQLHQFLVKTVPGVGKSMADKLLNRYGAKELVKLLDNADPIIITEIKGMGITTAKRIWETWQKERYRWAPFQFLHGLGIRSHRLIKRIIDHFGNEVQEIIDRSPYRLLEVKGISFQMADKVAEKIGIEGYSPVRIMAAITYLLNNLRFSGEGHTYMQRDYLYQRVLHLLAVDEIAYDIWNKCLYRLEQAGKIVVVDSDCIYAGRIYEIERSLAYNIIELKNAYNEKVPLRLINSFLKMYEKNEKVEITETQKMAIKRSTTTGVMVLTGGPGTGKTFTVGAMVEMYESLGKTVVLCSPTGKSARRIEESTGKPASTIHRLLKATGNGWFEHNRDNPLDGDVFIVDEVSMVNMELMHHLIGAIPLGKQLILIGDIDQLPAIGMGNVLGDIIRSGVVPVVELHTVHRQGAMSEIVLAAQTVNAGITKLKSGKKEFFVMNNNSDETLLDMITNRIPGKFGIDSLDIKVITPFKRSNPGYKTSQYYNKLLQQHLNPKGKSVTYYGNEYRVGDPVMQQINNYDIEVFNGEVGTITEVIEEKKSVLVRVDYGDERGVITYIDSELSDIELAYAMTIHKVQGSEFPAVIIVLPELSSSTGNMLKRNLLYTAITRAQKLCVVISDNRSLYKCISDNSYNERLTKLNRWLLEFDRSAAKIARKHKVNL